MRQVRVTYADGHVAYIGIVDPFAALEHVAAHGPVMRSTIAHRDEDEDLAVEDRNLGRRRNPLERSVAA